MEETNNIYKAVDQELSKQSDKATQQEQTMELRDTTMQASASTEVCLKVPDLTAQIPEEERTVDVLADDTDVAKAETVPVAVVRNLQVLVSKDEQAITDAEPLDAYYDVAKGFGYLTPVVGMAQLQNVCNDSVYASILERKDGYRVFQCCQKYTDDTYSSLLEIQQYDLYMLANQRFSTDTIMEKGTKNQCVKFLRTVVRDVYGKFNSSANLNVPELLKALVEVRESLPVFKESLEDTTPKEFYKNVVRSIHSCFDQVRYAEIYRKSYYAMYEGTMGILAQHMHMKEKELIERLYKNQFLYLAPSSEGYQTKIRIEKDTPWAYCILRLESIGNQNASKKLSKFLNQERQKQFEVEF